MGLPRQLPPGGSSSGHGPFGDKAFKVAVITCVVLVIVGLATVLAGSGALGSVGASFLALGALGLIVSGVGLLAERVTGRRPPPPPRVRDSNGRGPRR
jgi:hypothetical protein